MQRLPPGWRPPLPSIHVGERNITFDREREWSLEALAERREQSEVKRLRVEVSELRAEIARRDRADGAREGALVKLARTVGGSCN